MKDENRGSRRKRRRRRRRKRKKERYRDNSKERKDRRGSMQEGKNEDEEEEEEEEERKNKRRKKKKKKPFGFQRRENKVIHCTFANMLRICVCVCVCVSVYELANEELRAASYRGRHFGINVCFYMQARTHTHIVATQLKASESTPTDQQHLTDRQTDVVIFGSYILAWATIPA